MKRKARTIPGLLIVTALLLGLFVRLIHQELQQDQRDRALIAAIQHNDTMRALALLQAGASANARQTDAIPPTFLQLLANWRTLLSGHPYVRDSRLPTALMLAVGADNTTVVHALLARRAGAIDAFWLFKDWEGETQSLPLLLGAAMHGNPDIVRELLAHGADIYAQTAHQDTALTLATANAPTPREDQFMNAPDVFRAQANRYRDTMQILLDAGADLKNGIGEAALWSAAEHDQFEVVKALLDRNVQATVSEYSSSYRPNSPQRLPGNLLVRCWPSSTPCEASNF